MEGVSRNTRCTFLIFIKRNTIAVYSPIIVSEI